MRSAQIIACSLRGRHQTLEGCIVNANHLAKDCWVITQLAGIRMLEEQLSQVLAQGSRRQKATLHLEVAKLDTWVRQVDRALSTPDAG